MPHVYILKCADDSYYVGSTTNLERRFREHQRGYYRGYTSIRRPVELVWSAEFPTRAGAFQFERQVKGWTRAKKEAMIHGDWNGIHKIVKTKRKTREKEKQSKAQKRHCEK